MEENKNTVNTTETAVPQTEVVTVDDTAAKIAALEAEKSKLIEEGANWKVAALKYKSKAKEDLGDEGDEDKMKRFKTVLDESLQEYQAG